MNAVAGDSKRGSSERRALGKGLDSLLPRVAASSNKDGAGDSEAGKPLEIALEQIDRNPFQTRTHFDEQLLDELAGSITANGVVQPIVVRPLPNGRYQLIAGERRWLASKKANKATIPAILKTVSDEQSMEITIIENLQRADLNPIEQGRAYERLSREFGLTQEQMAYRTGKDRASVGSFLRMLKLPESVQSKVANGSLSPGHAKALLPLSSADEIEKVVGRIFAYSLNVRQTEHFVQELIHPDREFKKKEPAKAPPVDPNVQDAQDRLQRALGLRVRIEDNKGRGRVIIEYGRLEDFDSVLDLITGGHKGKG